MSETICLAFTGASGMPYGLRLLECLLAARCRVQLLYSQVAQIVARQELGLHRTSVSHVPATQAAPPLHARVQSIVPPQPSSTTPHARGSSAQVAGSHMQAPATHSAPVPGHVPQLPPQPSSPHKRPAHEGVHESDTHTQKSETCPLAQPRAGRVSSAAHIPVTSS